MTRRPFIIVGGVILLVGFTAIGFFLGSSYFQSTSFPPFYEEAMHVIQDESAPLELRELAIKVVGWYAVNTAEILNTLEDEKSPVEDEAREVLDHLKKALEPGQNEEKGN